MAYPRKQFLYQQCMISTPATVGNESTILDAFADASTLQTANKAQWALAVTVKHHQMQVATDVQVERGYLIQLSYPETPLRVELANPMRAKYRNRPMYQLLLLETT